jgi:hypothetical protein
VARGFFGRIRGAVGNFVNRVSDIINPKPPEEPEEEPTEEPTEEHERSRHERHEDMAEQWRESMRQRPGRSFRRHRSLFESLPDIDEEDDDSFDHLWGMYLEYMVKGRHQRNSPSNPWWSAIGLDPRNFDWSDFRTAMGYKARRR